MTWSFSLRLSEASIKVDYGLSYVPSSVSWRIPLILQCLFALLITAACCFLPDSPRWYFFRGRHDEGLEALSSLRNLEPTDPELLAERDDILAAIELEKDAQRGWKSLFVDGGVRGRQRVIIACFVQVGQQLTGTNSEWSLECRECSTEQSSQP